MKKIALLALVLVGCSQPTPDGYHASGPEKCFAGMDDILREYATSLSLVEKSRSDKISYGSKCTLELGATGGGAAPSRTIHVTYSLAVRNKRKSLDMEQAEREYRVIRESITGESRPIAGPDEGASWVRSNTFEFGRAAFRDANFVLDVSVSGLDTANGRTVTAPGRASEELAVRLAKTQLQD